MNTIRTQLRLKVIAAGAAAGLTVAIALVAVALPASSTASRPSDTGQAPVATAEPTRAVAEVAAEREATKPAHVNAAAIPQVAAEEMEALVTEAIMRANGGEACLRLGHFLRESRSPEHRSSDR